jgi:transcriptional regulator with XRE-family HTH domain
MSTDLTRELVIDLRAWYEDNDVSQKNLARKLYLTPQQLSEIFAGRNRPTGEQVLRIQEFLRTNMKTDYLDPRIKPQQAASNPGQPKTLTEARDRIADLEAQLRGSAKPAAPASPTGKAKAADAPPFPPINTPGGSQPNKTPMASGPKAPSIILSADLDSPVKIQAVLDKMNLHDLRLALNGTKDKLQIALLIREIRARRQLVNL